jgi:hypothetical protein
MPSEPCPTCGGHPNPGTYCEACGTYVAEEPPPLVHIDYKAEGLIPWSLSVGPGHHAHPWARILRAHGPMLHGLDVPPEGADEVKSLTDLLAVADEVIDYDRISGFRTVPRDPALDATDAIVRVPVDHPSRQRD